MHIHSPVAHIIHGDANIKTILLENETGSTEVLPAAQNTKHFRREHIVLTVYGKRAFKPLLSRTVNCSTGKSAKTLARQYLFIAEAFSPKL